MSPCNINPHGHCRLRLYRPLIVHLVTFNCTPGECRPIPSNQHQNNVLLKLAPLKTQDF